MHCPQLAKTECKTAAQSSGHMGNTPSGEADVRSPQGSVMGISRKASGFHWGFHCQYLSVLPLPAFAIASGTKGGFLLNSNVNILHSIYRSALPDPSMTEGYCPLSVPVTYIYNCFAAFLFRQAFT